MITTAMAAVVAADRDRVWQALARPTQILRWDDARIALVDEADEYPVEGRAVRWRYRLGPVALVMKEWPRLVEPGQRLATRCTAGSFAWDQIYRLDEEAADRAQAARTRLSIKIATGNRVPLLGAELDRFEVRRLLIERVDATLRAVQKWCENEPPV